jgi:thioredoxin 1
MYFTDFKFFLVDVSKCRRPGEELNLQSIPEFIIYINGNIKARIPSNDELEITKQLAKVSPESPGSILVKEPENMIKLENFEEYQKIIEENKFVLIFFTAMWNSPSKRIFPFFKKISRRYPDFKFLIIDIEKARKIQEKEQIKHAPTFVIYYNGKKNFSYQGTNRFLLEARVGEFKKSFTNAETYKSKSHEHILKKIQRTFARCNCCDDDCEKAIDVYFCLECQYTMCEDCKSIEEGKVSRKIKKKMERIVDVNSFENVLKSNNKTVALLVPQFSHFYKSEFDALLQEYPQMKFIYVEQNKSTNDIFARDSIKTATFIFFEKEKEIKKFNYSLLTDLSINLYKFCNRSPSETYESKYHMHPLVKMNHIGYFCTLCKEQHPELSPVFRCNECEYDYCTKCLENEKKEANEPKLYNLFECNKLDEYERIIKENKIVIATLFVRRYMKYTHFFRHLAKKYKNIKFVIVRLEEAKEIKEKEEVEERQIYLFYYNGVRNYELELPVSELLEERVNEYDNEIFYSKYHEHPLKKVKRSQTYCSNCDEDCRNSNIYLCLNCQFVYCRECKEIEEGKEAPPKEYKLDIIRDVKSFDEIINNNQIVIAYFILDTCLYRMSHIKKFYAEYQNQARMVQVRKKRATNELFKRYPQSMCPELGTFLCFRNGKLESTIKLSYNYNINDGFIKFLNIKGTETFKSKNHQHELSKMNHLAFYCDGCKKSFSTDFCPVFRCIPCRFDYCLKCKQKEESLP